MTYFTNPVEIGSKKDTLDPTPDKGTVVCMQTVLVNFNAAGTGNSDATLLLPANSQILEIFPDTLTAWDSVTSAGLTIGTTAGGTELLASSDVKTNGRETTAPTAAQLAVWQNIGTTNTVYIRVAQVGTTTAGQARVTVVYSPK